MSKTLSIIIVSYNVREFLEQALISILKAVEKIDHEIFVVDNASTDNSAALVRGKFPEVRLIENSRNLGFAQANNQAIGQSTGEFICLINPDTIVQEDTFSTLLRFFEKQPHAGAVGSKILNPDGTLQLACRRSFPTPWVAFTKIIGLARLFPKSKWFGKYNLTYLDPEKSAQVEAISGSFMVIRRSVIDQVGLLDEDFFMYGEDLDWCFRIKEGGWNIYYVPDTQIIHFKGESSKKSPFEHRRIFYEAMRLFVRKHFGKGKALIPSWILIIAIQIRTLLSFFAAAFRYVSLPVVDFLVFSISLALAIYLRFHSYLHWKSFLTVHIIYSLAWLLSLAAHGMYSKYKLSAAKSISAVFIGWLFNSTFTYFFKQIAFSRAVIIYAGFFNILFVPGWRFLLKWLVRNGPAFFKQVIGKMVLEKPTIIVGDFATSAKIIHRLQARVDSSYDVKGVILLNGEEEPEFIEGVPVIGSLDRLQEIVIREKIQEVIFSTDKLPYDKILSTIAASNGLPVSYKLVPSNLDVIIGKATTDYLDDIPFVDIEYKLHLKLYRFVKRFFDLILAISIWLISLPLTLWYKWVRQIPLKQKSIIGAYGRNVYITQFPDSAAVPRRFQFLPGIAYVIKGDISFVGRDMDVAPGVDASKISLTIKPGLTGFEQINRHLNLNREDRENYHLYYLKNYSPLLDVEILIKSIFRNINEQ